jgi:tetratricopeptide (TPR) repeat protein
MKVMKRILLIVLLVFPALANAQDACKGFNWPEDPAQRAIAEEKNVLYTDALRNNNFQAAQKPHMWFLKNAPNFNTSIYINGVKIYNGLIEATEDEAKKNVLIDSLMLIYDMRREYCNEEAEVVSRKAFDSYRHTIRNTDKLQENLDLFDEAFELNPTDLPYYMMLPYMNVIRYNVKINKNLDELQILERYNKIAEILERQVAAETDLAKKDKLIEIQSAVDALLLEMVDMDCDFVKENLEPKFKADPTNIKLAKQIFKFMLEGKCTDDPLWLETGELIAENDPSFGLFKNLAIKAQTAGDTEKAENLFNKALEYATTPADKADIYSRFAATRAEQGRKAEARSMYYKALEADPSNKDLYTSIGLLYFNSFDQCKGEEDIVKDRAVFLAAYDMFQKAGNSNMAAKAKEQFPSKEEIFTVNREVGQTIEVGCWIGESTTIRTRD